MSRMGHREGFKGTGAAVGGREGGNIVVRERTNDDACPRHGSRYVIRRGTNRCPVGRKRKENCR